MGIYEFKKQDAYEFKNIIGYNAKEKGNELQFTYCPYCHGGQKRDKNTFSINLDTGKFKCLRSSCGASGNMITLSRDFNFSLSEDVDRYFNNNNYNSKFRTFKDKHIEVRDKAVKYLLGRGISEKTTKLYEITTKKDVDNILVFPFKNEKSELKFIKYRKIDFDKSKDKSKEWCEKDCMPILFGMDKCQGTESLVITEGQIDSLSVVESGIQNAVSVPTGCNGFTWIPHCWDWLVAFKEIVVFGDCENGKVTLSDELIRRFPNRVRIVRKEDYKGCKDANELLQTYGNDAVCQAVKNAEIVPMKKIIRLSEVEAVDIYSMESIKTGIKDIDRLLGGLYFGQLILLTGKRGEGKSTFMSQLIVEALEQGYKCLAYSGELLNFYFKRWIDLQIAGNKNLIEKHRDDGISTYTISNSNIDKINDWYRDKAYLYDNNVIDDEEMEDLLTVIENATCQYGIKLICIDNLMTALEVDANTDLYRAQSRFVGKLAKIAKVHNVVILLVAHPRKSKDGITNDDVSGSSDITNKVDVVMQYCRENTEDPNERVFKVSKNRLTGKLTSSKNKIFLHYSESCKRIVGDGDSFDREYSWKKNNDGFEILDDSVEIPF